MDAKKFHEELDVLLQKIVENIHYERYAQACAILGVTMQKNMQMLRDYRESHKNDEDDEEDHKYGC